MYKFPPLSNRIKATILSLLSVFVFSTQAYANEASDYMKRFQTYQAYANDLPYKPDEAFIQFIEQDAPLSRKLRAKLLYKLAQNKDWDGFLTYYKSSDDLTLTCYSIIAKYNKTNNDAVLHYAIPVWLSGSNQPETCNNLFRLALKNNIITDALISKRVKLALENRNYSLATSLLRQYKTPHTQDIKSLSEIEKNPKMISKLGKSDLHNDLFLYGLKRMIAADMDGAIKRWKAAKAAHLLSEKHQQNFIAQIALYKAMRNSEDAETWFLKVKPAYYTPTLIEWQIRRALANENWDQVKKMIALADDNGSPTWQYWLARSEEAQGNLKAAKKIYKNLAQKRNYYGFLASSKRHKGLSFEEEDPIKDKTQLKPYEALTQEIKKLYLSKDTLAASRLLNDFVMELPKEDKSALAYWLESELHWYDKSLFLCNNDELANQLALRFPLAYHKAVKKHASTYHVPKELIYAIIRQESTFRENVTSSAGAHGLMQLMPTTAKNVAKQERISFADPKQLSVPEKNIHLGSAYLKQLSKRFHQHPLLMTAAYNAGPRQAVFWMKNHPPKEMDIWVETLPWVETRNYIKNVISFYAVYQYRMRNKPDLSDFMEPLN